MLNFTIGPVQIDEEILQIGAEQIPYFRTKEFSEIMKENEYLVKKMSGAEEAARAVFLTASGTGGMEAVVGNLLGSCDKVLIVNGGSFGQRFVDLCQIFEISYTEIRLRTGEILTEKHLEEFQGQGYTGFLVNLCETSTGVLYDIELISGFCKQNNLLLVVDAISAFIADDVHMSRLGIDALIIGSQKALALPPGVSVVVLGSRAIKRVEQTEIKSLYFNLNMALKDGTRGQTPFTPAVGILLQMNKRLRMIDKNGVEAERDKIREIAEDFREKMKELPVKMVTVAPSNAVTALMPQDGSSAYDIYSNLKDGYNIWVCPNGGELKDKVFRVGHLGALTKEDNTILVDALTKVFKR